jgi:RNA polymerase sigma factor (sigma-70 family)
MDVHHLTFSDKAYIKLTADPHPEAGDEQALWRDFKKGDVASYAVIYRKYFFVLYQYGKKICNDHELVKDSIQDLFIKIWNNRENLKETTSIKYYLLTALKRKLLDTLSGPQTRLASDHELIERDLFVVEDIDEDEMLAKKEEVVKALNKLSGHQQKLLHLKFYKNRTNQEIAEEMGITIQSVYNAVFKTLKSLRNQLSMLIATILVYI